MRKILWIFFSFSLPAGAQVFYDFEKEDIVSWESYPPNRWEVSSVEPVSGNFSLHHAYDNSDACIDAISLLTAPLFPDSSGAVWRFRIRHAYGPSAYNNWGVFLLANRWAKYMTTAGQINGYVLGVNVQGTDKLLKLWHLKDGKYHEILATTVNWETGIGIQAAPAVEVEYFPGGIWQVRIDSAGSFSSVENVGSGFYRIDKSGRYFGIRYKYTKAQDMKLWMDDLSITGRFIPDTMPPVLDSLVVVDRYTLRLIFSEDIEEGKAVDPWHYMVDGMGPPDSVILVGGHELLLYFSSVFEQDAEYRLYMEGLTDLSGNMMLPAQTEFVYHEPSFQDVVINEIMYDPVPGVLLPQAEYIEIFNRSEHKQDLCNWILSAGTTRVVLPSVTMDPGQYLILTDMSYAGEFAMYGNVLGIPGFPALNNAGGEIFLCSPDGRLITYVRYDPTWHSESYKTEGGWALERVDPSNPCDPCGNWMTSTESSGGTPGRENAVAGIFPDLEGPVAKRIKITGGSQFMVEFSEPMDSLRANDMANYRLDHGFGYPFYANAYFPAYDRVELFFHDSLRSGAIYLLTFKDSLTDCAGNPAANFSGIRVAVPEVLLPGDMVINEVLFNPFPDEPDYVEIYNRSDRVYDLGNIYLASRNRDNGELDQVFRVSEGELVFPGDYKVFTIDPSSVIGRYFSHDQKAFVRVENLPSLPDTEGIIVLLNQKMQVIDEFRYTEDMHFPLLRKFEGVSLERVHYDRPAHDASNWHSASETAGYGTPGTVNSQFSEISSLEEEFVVEPEVFSPDNDGIDDVVNLYYHMPEPGYVANITLFDARGREVRRLVRNHLMGMEGGISWDGRMENGSQAGIGIYVFYIEVFDLNGRVKRIKKTCVLARRL
ncbi:MAG TPA: hypothetical protein ENN63_06925 [Bacteroidetes bacterium]|nr:hypothetical protein [Bacteroidota bacterium]